MRLRPRDERGLAAILISLSMVALLIIAGMVIDFGLARTDRQVNKSVADNAVAAGIHGFDRKDGQVFGFRGVCDALGYLRTNEPELASLPAYTESSVNVCSNTLKMATPCVSTVTTTHAAYTHTTADGRYKVTVKAPYTLPDPSFPMDSSYPSLASDVATDPCTQLAVIITETRDSGLGTLAGADKIGSTIRSVGRVKDGPGYRSPALLLLDRHNCDALSVGSAGNDNSSIHVYGAQVGPYIQPGTIHADSDAASCGPRKTVYQGSNSDAIVAYAAPDLSEHGIISSYAKRLGVADAIVSDGLGLVYGSDALTQGTGGKYPVSDMGLVTRKLIDERYLPGLTTAVSGARGLFQRLTSVANASADGYAILSDCTAGNQAAIDALDPTKPVYVSCTPYKGKGVIRAGRVFFSGVIAQQATTSLPNATEVYVVGDSADAIDASGGFQMHQKNFTRCPDTPQTESAHLFVRNGGIKDNNAVFQACNTAVIMMGGQNDACLPNVVMPYAHLGAVPEPTDRPCAGSTGTGQIDLSGGATHIDWTAPNRYDSMETVADADKLTAWAAQEDLAFWSESWGGNNNPTYKMAGNSDLHLVGVFMTPNAAPFTVTGSGVQVLNNAQYIATSFQVNGGASLNMTVDPDNTVTLPELVAFDLVR